MTRLEKLRLSLNPFGFLSDSIANSATGSSLSAPGQLPALAQVFEPSKPTEKKYLALFDQTPQGKKHTAATASVSNADIVVELAFATDFFLHWTDNTSSNAATDKTTPQQSYRQVIFSHHC